MQKIGMGAALGDRAGGAGLIGRADQALLVHKTGHAHFGNRFDDARTANAGDPDVGGGSRKTGVGGPQIRADDLEAGLFGRSVDLDPLYRAGGCTLAGGDLSALKRRAGGRGTGQYAGFIAQK